VITLSQVVQSAKKVFLENIRAHGSDPFDLGKHVPEAERWAKRIQKNHPEADLEILLLGVWLHDYGHYPLLNEDHAISGEIKAKKFLEEQKYDKEKIRQVLHCIRAHRCKDVLPETIEAKILACADSASHFTFPPYLDIARRTKLEGTKYNAIEKLDRDFRDIAIFPEVKKELTPLYKAWKKILQVYEKFEY
jgi:hypothetical protein